MCRVSDALDLRTAAQDALAAACLAHVEEPMAAVLDRAAVVEAANPAWASALLGALDEKERKR